MVKNTLDEDLFSSDESDNNTPNVMSGHLQLPPPAVERSVPLASSSNPGRSIVTKSQFSATKCDLIRVSANRFTYSKQYIIGYIILTVLSIVTVAISLASPQGCPHVSFYAFEIVVLLALMAEVIVRMLALGRYYWKSWWNVLDGFMMIICVITLGLVFAGCSTAVRRSRQSSTVLLVIRNLVQFIRLVNIAWRNRHNINNRKIDIDLDNVEDLGFELLPEHEDFDVIEREQIWNVNNSRDEESEVH
jgi:hypothetical protein